MNRSAVLLVLANGYVVYVVNILEDKIFEKLTIFKPRKPAAMKKSTIFSRPDTLASLSVGSDKKFANTEVPSPHRTINVMIKIFSVMMDNVCFQYTKCFISSFYYFRCTVSRGLLIGINTRIRCKPFFPWRGLALITLLMSIATEVWYLWEEC